MTLIFCDQGDTWQGMRSVVDEWYGGYTAGHLILSTVLEHLYNTTAFGDGGEGRLVFTGRLVRVIVYG